MDPIASHRVSFKVNSPSIRLSQIVDNTSLFQDIAQRVSPVRSHDKSKTIKTVLANKIQSNVTAFTVKASSKKINSTIQKDFFSLTNPAEESIRKVKIKEPVRIQKISIKRNTSEKRVLNTSFKLDRHEVKSSTVIEKTCKNKGILEIGAINIQHYVPQVIDSPSKIISINQNTELLKLDSLVKLLNIRIDALERQNFSNSKVKKDKLVVQDKQTSTEYDIIADSKDINKEYFADTTPKVKKVFKPCLYKNKNITLEYLSSAKEYINEVVLDPLFARSKTK